MKQIEAIQVVSELAASQWGLVTSAQALAAGVDRMALSRLEKSGLLVRLRRGVFRLRAVPAAKEDDIRAAWLSLMPSKTVDARLDDLANDFVLAGATAAYLYGYGDMDPEPYVFVSTVRKQLSSSDSIVLRRKLEARDIALRAGLPVLKLERLVYELLRERQDLSLVTDVVRDALFSGARIDEAYLAGLLKNLSKTIGFKSGQQLTEYLIRG